jgi:hypothetical protein
MSIEDLFDDDEDRAAAPPGRLRWLPALLLAVAGAALTYLVLRVRELTASPLVLFTAFAALALLHRVVTSIGLPRRRERSTRPMVSGEEPGHYSWTGGDGLRRAVGRWDRVLGWGTQDTERFHRLTVPALRELADERLRQRHGVTLGSDERRARELLGDPLWTLLTAPPRRPPRPRQFASLITRLEEL